jgi:hypothetical protein
MFVSGRSAPAVASESTRAKVVRTRAEKLAYPFDPEAYRALRHVLLAALKAKFKAQAGGLKTVRTAAAVELPPW